VKPKWRGRGLGEALLKKTLDECRVRGARRAVLEVAVDNEPAIRLYLKTGFRVKGVIQGYYVDRDAYLMELTLHDQLDSRIP
jgi:ribosomal-protein-alanine N-acetyltransferase